jgi:hypothetical protein
VVDRVVSVLSAPQRPPYRSALVPQVVLHRPPRRGVPGELHRVSQPDETGTGLLREPGPHTAHDRAG